MKRYHRCFIVDAAISREGIVLKDSTSQRWYVDVSKPDSLTQFKTWLASHFFNADNQKVTVFEYEERGEMPETENWIVGFNPSLMPMALAQASQN